MAASFSALLTRSASRARTSSREAIIARPRSTVYPIHTARVQPCRCRKALCCGSINEEVCVGSPPRGQPPIFGALCQSACKYYVYTRVELSHAGVRPVSSQHPSRHERYFFVVLRCDLPRLDFASVGILFFFPLAWLLKVMVKLLLLALGIPGNREAPS